MSATLYFGYGLIVLSAVLLALHWRQWHEHAPAASASRRAFLRLQLQRRMVASGLIGVVGAAMTLVDYVPRTPLAMSGYLVSLLLASVVILLIAFADLRATRRRRDGEEFELLARTLREVGEDAARRK